MKQIEKRVVELEDKTGNTPDPVRLTRVIVEPGQDGPAKVGRYLRESGQVKPER